MSAREQAATIIEHARMCAEQVRAQARAKASAIEKKARAEASAIEKKARAEAGAIEKKARAEARTRARAELADEHRKLAAARARALTDAEHHVARLALAAGRSVLGHELTSRPEEILAIVAPLVGKVRRASRMLLRLHPADAEVLQARLACMPELQATVHIEAVPGMARGGAYVQSDLGDVDGSVETRLSALAHAWNVDQDEPLDPRDE